MIKLWEIARLHKLSTISWLGADNSWTRKLLKENAENLTFSETFTNPVSECLKIETVRWWWKTTLKTLLPHKVQVVEANTKEKIV